MGGAGGSASFTAAAGIVDGDGERDTHKQGGVPRPTCITSGRRKRRQADFDLDCV